MRPLCWTLVLLGLLGCTGDSSKVGEVADSGPGLGAEDGADGAVGADGGEGADGTEPEPLVLEGVLRLPEGATVLPTLRVSLVHAGFDGSGPPELGAGLDTVTADGERFSLSLPERPPEAHIVELARAWPEALGAVYLPLAYEAEDGDPEATFRDGHLLRAGGLDQLLVWLDPAATELPEGWPTGWSIVDSGMAGMHEPNRCLFNTSEPLLWREHAGYPHFRALDAGLDLLLRGLPTTLVLAADSSGRPSGVDRLAGIPSQVAYGTETDLEPVFDVDIEAGFSVVLEDAPPADHDVTTDADWVYTQALGLLYTDLDESGDWSLAGDEEGTTGYTHCVDEEPVLLRYTREPRSWKGYRFLDCYGGTAGWRGVVFDESIGNYAYVEPELAGALEIGRDCSF